MFNPKGRKVYGINEKCAHNIPAIGFLYSWDSDFPMMLFFVLINFISDKLSKVDLQEKFFEDKYIVFTHFRYPPTR